jgi:DNA-binding transcriptional LysR family regulator
MDHFNIEIRELKQIQAIAAERSFVKASNVLHISQPALSRSIKALEDRIGIRIFDRGREGADPTDPGLMVLKYAESVLAAASDMQRGLSFIRGVGTGVLRVGTGIYPSELFVGQAIGKLLHQHPDVRMNVTTGSAPELLRLLRKRELDVIIADPEWANGNQEIKQIPLSTHQAYLVARSAHPLFSYARPTLDDAIKFPFVIPSVTPPQIIGIPVAPRSKNARLQLLLGRWTPKIQTESISIAKDILKNSDGIALASLHMIQHEQYRGELQILPIYLKWLKASFSIMHLSQRSLGPLAQQFCKLLTEAATTISEEET